MNQKHNSDLYNTLLFLSRNLFFYTKITLKDNFESRIYLMFIHFSIMMLIYKEKGKKFDQRDYDSLFHNIENNLRELGFGDVSVNKKMKDLNKVLYDILLKLNKSSENEFIVNEKLISIYFKELNNINSVKYKEFNLYLNNFYKFCFELPLNNMIREARNFNYGSS